MANLNGNMIEEYVEYLSLLYQRIPDYVYLGCLSIFVLGAVSAICTCGLSKGWRILAKLSLFEYIVLTYCSTVIYRKTNDALKVELQPLIKITEVIDKGGHHAYPELVMNVIVFVILGVLLGMAYDRMKWWCLLMVGGSVSLSIETMQLIFQRGTVETDDVILNSLGCLIGIAIVSIIKRLAHCQQLYCFMK